MSIALEVRGVRKRYIAGDGNCVASANVLRGIDLTVRCGDAIAIIGAAGAGKSTLMLCLAGLLRVDAGDIEWFGERDRALAARRAVYHVARTDLLRAGAAGDAHVHLVDLPADVLAGAHVRTWMAGRRAAGDAIVVGAREADSVADVTTRMVELRGGVLRPHVRAATRVAEGFARAQIC
jgi:energy-coupling factor transporter ATP-binding protein EcfA2